ncbi:hypothetical protein A1O3_02488 [Capronia epimyces CBS 606.96]|uniref:Cytochrome P450 n=1 Tax=Capronia epimyces CBS 606.96 TaxID=1182542 RepID=W9YJK9_9EURO|nr:uncharacterized protein A1O3_02488 [Capronia epimyces CBS 606.96]EXJ89421.1 hypothetical protein A1O3_02488 [Capronia epimyces CBS 606.96]
MSSLIEHNYPRFQDRVFKLRDHFGPVHVIPAQYVEALCNAPESVLSFQQLARERFFARYTLLASRVNHPDNNTVIKSIQKSLSQHLGKAVAELHDELREALRTDMSECTSWTPFTPTQMLIPIIAKMSGRVFIGRRMGRRQEYLDCIINFTIDSMTAAEMLRLVPSFTHPLVQWLIPHTYRARSKLRTIRRLLYQEIITRSRERHHGSLYQDMLVWNIRNSPPARAADMTYQAHNQLLVSTAAIHTTNMQLTHVLFDLAAHPEYVDPLREEVDAVMRTEKEKEKDGRLGMLALSKLRKLDSFLKESQRMNPLGLLTFERKVMSNLTLPNGQTILKGSYIGVPTSAIAKDPAIFPDPEKFDGFRFERLRAEPGSEAKHQLVSTGPDALYFGHGKHACPGRFLAAIEMKLILIELISRYDFKMPHGETRPRNIELNSGVIPDPQKKILLRRRDAVTTV